MATLIFVDQENVASTTLSKDRLKQTSYVKPQVKSNLGKVFGSSGTVKPRKALGNVNKQDIQTSVSLKKGALKEKTSAPATKQVCIKPRKQSYPEVEKCLSYNPADFETFSVPEEHKLSNIYLAGVPLIVHDNDADQFDALLNWEHVPLDIPVFEWESDMSSTLPSFLATIDDITPLPQMVYC